MVRRVGSVIFAAGLVLVAVGCERGPLPGAARVTPGNPDAIRQALVASKAGAGGPAAEVENPTGWASLRGRFVIQGTPPPRTPLSVTKDHSICAPGGAAVLNELLVVDSSGGIKDVVIYLTKKIPLDDPAWIHADYEAEKEAEKVFDQKQCVFLSHMFAARTSNRIRLQNSDPVGHNTNINGKGSASTNVNMAANDSAVYVPGKESPEPFDVACSVHPWMSAKMLIRDTPYFAVTAPDGSFEIKNLPAGVELEFRVWQEKSKFVQNVTLDGTATKWPRGRYKVKLEPDKDLEIKVEVPAAAFGG